MNGKHKQKSNNDEIMISKCVIYIRNSSLTDTSGFLEKMLRKLT